MISSTSKGEAAGEETAAASTANREDSCMMFVSNVCAAIESDDNARLASLLGLDLTVEATSSSEALSRSTPATAVDGTSHSNVDELLHTFCGLIGENSHLKGGQIEHGVSVRAHLVLRALFRASSLDAKYIHVSWKATTATIQSLQFTTNITANNPSHREQLALIAEMRAFLLTNVLQMVSTVNGAKDTLRFVLHVGQCIIDPLLNTCNNSSGDEVMISRSQERKNSYLLPLELIPAILAVADGIDGIRIEILDHLHENREDELMGTASDTTNEPTETDQASDGCPMDVDPTVALVSRKDKDEKSIEEHEIASHISVSDRILTALFGSKTQNSIGSRSMRADAALPILALAIDDIGFGRMSTAVSTVNGRDVTYWDCLRSALNDVISSSIRYCTKKDITTTKNETFDEGIHVIPHSDYPALIRCIFRMITANKTNQSLESATEPTWESLLLRAYHAVIVTTLAPRLAGQTKQHDMDRMAILGTVESHVLVPAFTGASVSAIRLVLNACAIECCRPENEVELRSNEINAETADDTYTGSIPLFAVAGLVLLIMKARTVSDSHQAAGFGPRSVFHITSKVLRNGKDTPKNHIKTGRGSDDEFGLALCVLLNLSGIGAEDVAYEVLKFSYYEGDGRFVPRYSSPIDESMTYRYDIGLRTLASYANLVRSSLTHGMYSSEKLVLVESFVADTSRAWLDAAMMLLDDGSNLSSQHPANLNQNGRAFAVVIIVVVFCEVQSSQHYVCKSLYERLLDSASDGCCNDSHLLLLATLVWSTASRDEKNTFSLEVFGRKDEMHKHNMSVFGPICSLLSRPMISEEQKVQFGEFFSSHETAPLTFGAILQIARSLAPVPLARESLLSLAKKHMRVFSLVRSENDSSAKPNPFIESMPFTQAANRDSVYYSLACLCILIEKVQPSEDSMDDCGYEALSYLTDIIVLRRPTSLSSSSLLPTRVVSWILSEMNKSVSSLKISTWTYHRLLRACLAALLKCFTLDNDKANSAKTSAVLRSTVLLDETNPVGYDVYGLLKLANSLCCALYTDNNTYQTDIKIQLLNTLLNKEAAVSDENVCDGISRLMNSFTGSDGPDDMNIDTKLLTSFVIGAFKFVQSNISVSEYCQTSNSHLMQCIIDSERLNYLTSRSNNSQQSRPCVPNWLNVNKQTDDVTLQVLRVERVKNEGCSKELMSSLCCLSVGIIMSGYKSSERQDPHNSPTSIESDLIQGVNALWAKVEQSLDVCSLVPLTTLIHLIDTYSRHLQLLLKSKEQKPNLAQLEVSIKYVLGLCGHVITSALKENSIDESLYRIIWRLYCTVADESSSRALISLVNGVYEQSGWASTSPSNKDVAAFDVNESTFSLTTISSHDAFDDQIQFVRRSILSALSQLTKMRFHRITYPTDGCPFLSLLIESLLKLCQDLSDGFLGSSGGITKSLFVLYVEAIEGCITNIESIAGSISVDTLRQYTPRLAVLIEAAVVIWNAFCEHAFKEAFLVKAVLTLCVVRLPGLVRKIERAVGCCIESTSQLMPSVILLDQVCATLAKQAEGNTAKKQTGSDIKACASPMKGPHHLITQLVVPDFASPNVVTWACNISFSSMLSVWNDSYKAIMSTETKPRQSAKLNSNRMAFAKHRICGFQSLHFSICRMFDTKETSDKSTTAGISEDADTPANNDSKPKDTKPVLAEMLTQRGKSLLCSCLERMMLTMNSSIKTICLYLKSTTRLEDSRLLESLSCALGCFSSIISQCSGHDFVSGPAEWFVAESKRLDSEIPNPTGKADDYSILHRLQKIIYRSESVHAELKKLYAVTEELRQNNHHIFVERTYILNELASSTCTPNAVAGFDFSELLDQCIQIIQTRTLAVQKLQTDGFLSPDEDQDIDDDDFTYGRKRRCRARARRSRKMPLRSRNETIDDWLTLDDEELATAPGEVYNVDDAFVDLEDFIVEG